VGEGELSGVGGQLRERGRVWRLSDNGAWVEILEVSGSDTRLNG
jgi:hypothetical protein